MDNNILGNMIKEYRLKNKISLAKLALSVGFTVPYIWDIEKGRRIPNKTETIEKIAIAIEMDPNKLKRLVYKDDLIERLNRILEAFESGILKKEDISIEVREELIDLLEDI